MNSKTKIKTEYREENNMPTKSKAQEKLMQAVAHNPKFAKKVGIPVKVGKEFVKPIKKKK
jgi:hypothetical protein